MEDQPQDSDRRKLFRRAAYNVGKTVSEAAEKKIRKNAARWIRPPYALDEYDFLLTCTRCNACVDACPHNIIFNLAARLGPEFANTPALDLLNFPCMLCSDWPCVHSCETGALKFPEADDDLPQPLPLLSSVRVDITECIAWLGPDCGACADSCPVPGALSWQGAKPQIDPDLCIGCTQCRQACITDPKAIQVESLYKNSHADSGS